MDEIKINRETNQYNEINPNEELQKQGALLQNGKNTVPNPEENKKRSQEKRLNQVLRKKETKVPRISRKLYEKMLNPGAFIPEQKSLKGQPDIKEREEKQEKPRTYRREKEENLKKDAIVQHKLDQSNIEKDRKINKADSINERMKLEWEYLIKKTDLKLKRMLAANQDPLEVDYIKACVDLDKNMKYRAIYENVMAPLKNNETKWKTIYEETYKETCRKMDEMIRNSRDRLKRFIRVNKREEALKAEAGETERRTPETKEKTIKPETKKNVKTGKPVIPQGEGNQRNQNHNIINNNTEIETFEYTQYENGKSVTTFTFIKRKPQNLQDALELRSQITKNFDVKRTDLPQRVMNLYLYCQGFVEEYSKTEEITFPEEYLKQIDVSNYNLETVVMLRNRITDGGLLYSDLKGKAKETYDYYDSVVQNLIKNDGTMLDRVVQHEARQMPAHQITLQTNLGTEYERQAPKSNDCWSCAGSAILNHYLRNDKNYKKVTQEEFRAYIPDLKSKEEMGMDDVTYEKQKTDIETFTTENQEIDRAGSPEGNPYMLADFYLDKLKQAGKKNVAVRKMVFQAGLATKQKRGMKNKDKQDLGQDTNALHNLRAKFADTVKEALNGDSVLTLLYGKHYLTITGIDKDVLKVHNSLGDPSKTEFRRISDILMENESQRGIELMWFQKIKRPEDVTDKFKNVTYDPVKKEFGQSVGNYSENIAQKKGVGAWKNLTEKDADIAELVQDGIYLPRQFEE